MHSLPVQSVRSFQEFRDKIICNNLHTNQIFLQGGRFAVSVGGVRGNVDEEIYIY